MLFLCHDIAPSHLSFKFPSTDLQVILIPKMLLSSIALGVWLLLGPAMALTGSQTSLNFSIISVNPINPSTCVAPSDYTSCDELAVTIEQQCISESTTEEGKNACGCVGFIEQMNCFARSCWNRVCYIRHLWELLLIFCLQIYGCEYQSLVANYIRICQIMTLPVPYWPAPDNAPGSCSCNTGEVIEAFLGSQTSGLSCSRNAESLSLSEIPAMEEACVCCMTSITISAYVISTVF
jgi:hypothetical protein